MCCFYLFHCVFLIICYVLYNMSISSTSDSYLFLSLIAVFWWPIQFLFNGCSLWQNNWIWSRSPFITSVIWSIGEDFLTKTSKHLCMCWLVDSNSTSDNDPNAYPKFNQWGQMNDQLIGEVYGSSRPNENFQQSVN